MTRSDKASGTELWVTRARLLAELAQLIFDPHADLARRFGSRDYTRARERMPGASEVLEDILCMDPAIREEIARRVFEGDPGHWGRATQVLGEISGKMDLELRRQLLDPQVRLQCATRATTVNGPDLIGLLKWAYEYEPRLAESIEREVVGDVRTRFLAVLFEQPHNLRGAERLGHVAPLMADLASKARELRSDPPLRGKPRGFSIEVAASLEKNPARVIDIDLDSVAQFIRFPHRAKRRSIAASSALAHLRALENLEQTTERITGLGSDGLIRHLSWLGDAAPEIVNAVIRYLENDRHLEDRIDSILERQGLDRVAGLLALLGNFGQEIRLRAEVILLDPGRRRRMADTALKTRPESWLGLLRQPRVSIPLLAELDRERWAEFWSVYPPRFPHWARALRQVLLLNGARELEPDPAEYVFFGTGKNEWSGPGVGLRHLVNALFWRGARGDALVLDFLRRIDYVSFLQDKYETESLWALAHFVDAIQVEQSAAVLDVVMTAAFARRFRVESAIAWEERNEVDADGFVALVGALGETAVRPPQLPPPMEARLVGSLSMGGRKDNADLLWRGLRRLATSG